MVILFLIYIQNRDSTQKWKLYYTYISYRRNKDRDYHVVEAPRLQELNDDKTHVLGHGSPLVAFAMSYCVLSLSYVKWPRVIAFVMNLT